MRVRMDAPHNDGLRGVSTSDRPPKRRFGLALGFAMLIAALTAVTVDDVRLRDRPEAASLQGRIGVLEAQNATLGGRLETAQTELISVQHRLSSVRDRLGQTRALTGPAVADGTYPSVTIHAVGADQGPAVLLFDDEEMFTQDDAVTAAIEDGKDPAVLFGDYEPCTYCLYFRNVDPTWQMAPIASDAEVQLNSWQFRRHGGYEVVTVPLLKFGSIFNGTLRANAHLHWMHYRVEVENGNVVGIYELNLSP